MFRVPVVLAFLSALLAAASGSVGFTAATTVPKSSVDRVQTAQGPNDYKPNECDGFTVSALVISKDGTAANELILGTSGGDSFDGQGGQDCVLGGGGNDDVRGGSGNDVVMGGPGADTVRGGDGNDTLYGGTGTDECRGENGTDTFPAGDCEDVQP